VDLLVHSELNSVWLFFIPCFVVRMRNLYDYGYDVKHLLGCAPYCCPQALSPASCKMAGSKSAGVCVCVFGCCVHELCWRQFGRFLAKSTGDVALYTS